jgi:hypothetical protein
MARWSLDLRSSRNMRGKKRPPRHVKRQAEDRRDSRQTSASSSSFAYPLIRPAAAGIRLAAPGNWPPISRRPTTKASWNPVQIRNSRAAVTGCKSHSPIVAKQTVKAGGAITGSPNTCTFVARHPPAGFPAKRVQWSSAKEDRREMAARHACSPLFVKHRTHRRDT